MNMNTDAKRTDMSFLDLFKFTLKAALFCFGFIVFILLLCHFAFEIVPEILKGV